MKVIAMYLPQFHRVPENDRWWGEGFTDWVSAKKALPLFKNHYQPHVPFDENYYNLLEKSTMQWQADLMHQYSVDGMCFYHYWFKDGKRILERPAENLLQWTDIDMPFCFCWANESWTRTWEISSNENMWTLDFKGEETGTRFLLEQGYGTKQDWKEHFEYLLPFFRDNRYLLIDGKPVFQFYQAAQISCLDEMIQYWNELAKVNGFPGIFTMVANCNGMYFKNADAEFLFELSKSTTYSEMRVNNGIRGYSYDDIWNYILSAEGGYKCQYKCAIVSYDNTPRKQKYGLFLSDSSPQKFGEYLSELISQSKRNGLEYVFVNAWNEWGEGNHLEPDKKYEFQWLEQVKAAKESTIVRTNITNREVNIANSGKFETYFLFMDKWMKRMEQGRFLDKVFGEKKYNSLLLYGYGIIGRHVIEQLKCSDIEIKGIIDQRNLNVKNYQTFLPEDKLPDADMILVTSFYYFKDIEENLKTYGVKIPIISIEQII